MESSEPKSAGRESRWGIPKARAVRSSSWPHASAGSALLAAMASAVARAGGNIISATLFDSGQVTFKEQGADETKLRQYLQEAKEDIVHSQGAQPYQPRLVK